MEIVFLEKEKPTRLNASLLLGDFDGVHLGHQSLVKKAKEFDEEIGALLFDVDPVFFLNNGKSKKVISTLEQRIETLKELGVSLFYVIHTTKSFLSLDPIEFMEKVLLPLKPARLIVGSDYRFGKMAKGDVETLKRCFQVEVVPLLIDQGNKIASRDIKSLIENGELEKASALLGHPFEIIGKVVEGLHNGRKIGFPTINLKLSSPYVLPKNGVYLSEVKLGDLSYPAITNVGTNPTIGLLDEPIIESHLDGYQGEAYGEKASVSFLSFLREEIKFADLEALKSQLQIDMNALRASLK